MGGSRNSMESGQIEPEEFTYTVHDELALLRLVGMMRTTDASLGRLQLVVERAPERRLQRSANVMASAAAGR